MSLPSASFGYWFTQTLIRGIDMVLEIDTPNINLNISNVNITLDIEIEDDELELNE